MAEAVIKQLNEERLLPENINRLSRQKQMVGRQPRGQRGTQIVPEFKQILWLAVQGQDVKWLDTWIKPLKATKWIGHIELPIGTRLLRSIDEGGEGRSFRIQVAIPWSVGEFTEEATKVLHPFDATNAINDDVSRAVFQVATLGIAATESFRLKQMAHYFKRAIALTEDERKLKAGLSKSAATLLNKKKILLFKEMWADAEGDDPTLVADLTNGFLIAGEAPASGAFSSYPLGLLPTPTDSSSLRGSSAQTCTAARLRSA